MFPFSKMLPLRFAVLVFLQLTAVFPEKLIVQLDPKISFNSFEQNYSNLLEASNFERVEIGSMKAIIGEFNLNLQKSIYFDKSVLSINSDADLNMCEVQSFAPRHLVRLSQLNSIHKRQKMNFKFELLNPVNVYILDTGINSKHPDFTNRVEVRKHPNILKVSANVYDDSNGHGTAIASVVGSQLLGVCKNCNIISYQILDEMGKGKMRTLILALQSIFQNEKPGIIVMPFVTPKSQFLNDVLHEMKVSNFSLVAPAGNSNEDACNYSPASSVDVLTVGSIDSNTDTIAKFSNYGPCVDLFADGVNIITLDHENELLKLRSGTSLSAGITAGLVATFLGLDKVVDGESNYDAIKKLKNTAIENRIKPREFFKETRTPNKILHNYSGNLKNVF